MNTTSLSKTLRNLRVEKRLTQEDLATASRVSRRAISALENEVTFESVNLSTLSKVLAALGHTLRIAPARAPTLSELVSDKNRLQPGAAESRVRVRRTREERQDMFVPPASQMAEQMADSGAMTDSGAGAK